MISMTLERARDVLVQSCGRCNDWYKHRIWWVKGAIETVMHSDRATDDDLTLAVSVELSLHGKTRMAQVVLYEQE